MPVPGVPAGLTGAVDFVGRLRNAGCHQMAVRAKAVVAVNEPAVAVQLLGFPHGYEAITPIGTGEVLGLAGRRETVPCSAR